MQNLITVYAKRILTGLLFCLSSTALSASNKHLKDPTEEATIPWQLYIAFSGEVRSPDVPINVIEAFSVEDEGGLLKAKEKKEVFTKAGEELRNTTLDDQGNLYVTQAHKTASCILQFGPIKADGSRDHLGQVITPKTSSGLNHPYAIAFDYSSPPNMYVSCQDTNIVLGFSQKHPGEWHAMPIPKELRGNDLAPGTFVAASSAAHLSKKEKAPEPIHESKGGLTFASGKHTHSVRGIAFDDKGNLYVANQAADSVNIYNADGKFLGGIPDHHNQISKPVQIRFHDHHIYIGCPGNSSVQVYDLEKQRLSSFIEKDREHLESVSGMDFGSDGNFYVANRDTKMIYRYDAAGAFKDTFIDLSQFGISDAPEGIMWCPVPKTHKP